MPYGMPKDIDSDETNSKMERCVAQVMKSGKNKTSAIKICKASMIKAHHLREMSEGKKK